MDEQNIPLYLAFFAGILSFISPCHLPMVPVYIGFLGGSAASEGASKKLRTVSYAVAFVLGYSVILVALGASVGLVGWVVRDYMPMIRKLGGVALIILGLHMSGILKIPALYQEKRFDLGARFKPGYGTSFLLGALFGVAWTPCVGPILAGILLLATTSETVGQGAYLLSAYSLGLGVPFVLASVLMGSSGAFIRRLNRHGSVVSLVSGLLLVGMGMLVFTNQFQRLAGFFNWVPPL